MADSIEKSREGLTELKVNIDVSEALAGLKSIKREAKAASRAVKELEAVTKRACLRSDDKE